jgi:hypothetical protein
MGEELKICPNLKWMFVKNNEAHEMESCYEVICLVQLVHQFSHIVIEFHRHYSSSTLI